MKPQDPDLKAENFAIDTSISLQGDNPLTNIKSKKQLWIIIGIVVLNSIGMSIVLPLLPFIVGKYLSSGQVVVGMSALLSVFAACTFFAAPILGALSDRYGRKIILLISLSGSVIGYVLFGMAVIMYLKYIPKTRSL